MDIKKRPLEDDQEMGIAKKRAMASITGSPIPVNGKMDGGREHLNIDNLEVRLNALCLSIGTIMFHSLPPVISQRGYLSQNEALLAGERTSPG